MIALSEIIIINLKIDCDNMNKFDTKKIVIKNHPHSYKYGQVYIHRVMAEKVIGKFLDPKHPIHHHHDDAHNTTLVICENNFYHQLLHKRTKALKECGHANYIKCVYCKQYDDPKYLIIGKNIYHGFCQIKFRREYYKRTGK